MSVENPLRTRGPAQRSTRGVLVVALIIAAVVTVLAVAAAIADLVRVITGPFETTLLADRALPATLVHGHLASGSWTAASAVVRDVPDGIRAIAGASGAGETIARAALGAAVVLLLASVLRRAPFGSRSALALTVLGGVAMISGLLAAGLGGLRGMMLADLLNGGAAEPWPPAGVVDPTTIAIGFVLMVIGLLVGHGAQLQDATDGLV